MELNYFRERCRCTVRNIRKFTTFLCDKGNVKFEDIYDIFE